MLPCRVGSTSTDRDGVLATGFAGHAQYAGPLVLEYVGHVATPLHVTDASDEPLTASNTATSLHSPRANLSPPSPSHPSTHRLPPPKQDHVLIMIKDMGLCFEQWATPHHHLIIGRHYNNTMERAAPVPHRRAHGLPGTTDTAQHHINNHTIAIPHPTI